MEDLQLWTVEELCSLLHLTRAAVYAQRSRNEPPGNLGIKLGKRILFKPRDISDYVDSRQALEVERVDALRG